MKHLRTTIAALLTAASALPGLAAEQTSSAPFSICTGPVLQCPTERSVRITWMTDRNATGTVEYGPATGGLKTAFTSHHGLVDANDRLHSVVLDGLQPGTLYRYRVISREIANFGAYKMRFGDAVTNEFHQFRTFDRRKREFSFVAFNDVHDQAATIPELLKTAPPCDFVIFNGDTISYSDDEKPAVSILAQAAASFASSIPMFWVRGNHETRGSFARQLPAYLGLPGDRYYYAFDHGPVHFLVLDTGEDKIDGHREYHGLADFSRYRREEAEWLRLHTQEDSFRRAKFRVVICHMPFPSRTAADPARYSEPNTFLGMAEAQKLFGRTLETAGIDLMLCGHMHQAAVVPPEPPHHSYPIVQGGGNKGDTRTLIRMNVADDHLEAVILHPDGSRAASCRVEPRSPGWWRTRPEPGPTGSTRR